MKPTKVHFSILAAISLLLALTAAYVLRAMPPTTRPQLLGWGFVLIAGCIFFVRAMFAIRKLDQ